MADININTAMPTQTEAVKPQPVRTETVKESVEAERTQPQSTQTSETEPREENIVSVSEHGDTVAVSDEGEELNELAQTTSISEVDRERSAAEILKEQAKVRQAESERILEEQLSENEGVSERTSGARQTENAEGVEENFEAQSVVSYNTYSDQQLEQMYLKGEISRIDYQNEMESREAEDEAEAEESEEFGREMSGINAIGRKMENDINAISTAYNSDNASGITAQQRLAAMEGLDNAQQASEETLARRAEEDFQVSIS